MDFSFSKIDAERTLSPEVTKSQKQRQQQQQEEEGEDEMIETELGGDSSTELFYGNGC